MTYTYLLTFETYSSDNNKTNLLQHIFEQNE